jgi:protocatechuate 3,4-dioxygenase beta subunit
MRRVAIAGLSLAMLIAAGGVSAQQTPVRDRGGDPIGPGSISGVVVSDEGPGHPVRRAIVQLTGTAIRMPKQVVSDDAGRFAFTGLSEGRFSIVVNKAGYVRSYAGARRPWRSPGVPIELAAGERKTNVVAVLQRGGVISGRVLDDQGQPLQNVRVQVMERRVTNGEAQLIRAGNAGGQLTTDDRGMYRVWGLAPGSYLVGAAPQQTTRDARLVTQNELQWALTQVQLGATSYAGRGTSAAGMPPPLAPAPERGPAVAYAPVYYPGATDASGAATVAVEPGLERSGIDFNLRFVPTAAVRGTVVMPDGTTPTNVQIALTPQGALLGDDLAAVGFTLRTSVNPQGQFTFATVGPGVYLLTARAASAQPGRERLQIAQQPGGRAGSVPGPSPSSRTPDLWAQIEIGVDGRDVDNVSVVFQRGMSVSGRVVFEGAAPDPLPRMSLTMRPERVSALLNTPTQSQPVNDGRFELFGLAPGRYVIGAPSTSAGSTGQGTTRRWTAKSAMWNGRDLLDEPIEIQTGQDISDVVVTYSDVAAEVTGAILDANGKPASGFFVMLFPADRARWSLGPTGARRFRMPTALQPDGRFRFADLPSGDYCLALLTDYEPQDLSDPAFLEQVSAASIRIALAHGEKKTQDIKLR